MINCWHVFLFCWLTSSVFAEAVNVCSVEPTAAVVTFGERVTLNCAARGDFPINSWQVGNHIENKLVVYLPPSYGPNGIVTKNQILADGYSVTNVTENKISLHMNQITFSQAGLYVCQCGDHSPSTATTVVVVLASEPQFTVIPSIATTRKSISFNCHISFNGSAEISSNLEIKDISGTISRIVCHSNNNLTSCDLNYKITANTFVDQFYQSYICSVQLIANNSIIYSRILNISSEEQRVTSAKIVVSDPSKCFDGKRFVCESITCKTDENPGKTFYKWWQIQNDGSKLEIGDGSQHLVLTKIGQFTYQCQAFNIFRGINYNVTSKDFTIDVTCTCTGCDERQVLAFPIALTVACIIIAILTATTIVLCRKLRQRNATDANKISTEDRPVCYEALDLRKSSEERQREPYTEIQLPIQSQQGQRGGNRATNPTSEYETVV